MMVLKYIRVSVPSLVYYSWVSLEFAQGTEQRKKLQHWHKAFYSHIF